MGLKPKSSNLFDVYNREALVGIDVKNYIKVVEIIGEYKFVHTSAAGFGKFGGFSHLYRPDLV